MGLYLLSVIAARDFGWLGTHDAVDRLEATLGTMKDLERYRARVRAIGPSDLVHWAHRGTL